MATATEDLLERIVEARKAEIEAETRRSALPRLAMETRARNMAELQDRTLKIQSARAQLEAKKSQGAENTGVTTPTANVDLGAPERGAGTDAAGILAELQESVQTGLGSASGGGGGGGGGSINLPMLAAQFGQMGGGGAAPAGVPSTTQAPAGPPTSPYGNITETRMTTTPERTRRGLFGIPMGTTGGTVTETITRPQMLSPRDAWELDARISADSGSPFGLAASALIRYQQDGDLNALQATLKPYPNTQHKLLEAKITSEQTYQDNQRAQREGAYAQAARDRAYAAQLEAETKALSEPSYYGKLFGVSPMGWEPATLATNVRAIQNEDGSIDPEQSLLAAGVAQEYATRYGRILGFNAKKASIFNALPDFLQPSGEMGVASFTGPEIVRLATSDDPKDQQQLLDANLMERDAEGYLVPVGPGHINATQGAMIENMFKEIGLDNMAGIDTSREAPPLPDTAPPTEPQPKTLEQQREELLRPQANLREATISSPRQALTAARDAVVDAQKRRAMQLRGFQGTPARTLAGQ